MCFAGRQEAPVCGAYIRSFAQGLDDVLQDYRQALLDVESSLLADPHLTAAYVQTCLEEVKHCDSPMCLIMFCRPCCYFLNSEFITTFSAELFFCFVYASLVYIVKVINKSWFIFADHFIGVHCLFFLAEFIRI